MVESGHLGLIGVVSMSLGALIGGGIFAVLGVATNIAGKGVILSYMISSVIALSSGYSYAKLTDHYKQDGGEFIFLEHFSPDTKFAGMISWFLLLGYVGSMAMYAYAFGAFFVVFLNQTPIAGINGARVFFSISILVIFLLLNLRSIANSVMAENIMVYSKVIILLAFGLIGVYSISKGEHISVNQGGIIEGGITNPILAISVIFVSFQGFQILTYTYSEIRGGSRILEKGIYISLISASLIYILIASVTTSLLTPNEIIIHEETVLAYAASEIFTSVIFRGVAFYFIALAAIFSTASAINATLFSTARLVSTISSRNYLPGRLAQINSKGIPVPGLLMITGLTIILTSLSSLVEITAFASLCFLLIFAVVNFIAIKQKLLKSYKFISGIGLFGTSISLLLFVFYMAQYDLQVLQSIGIITGVVLFLEFIYFRYIQN
ncbi:MAG: amino acid permease [Candidatus Heimdallarchaeota archaeon]|nr:amino acid permease [Candidatus Heimdallarchaeota archaeon]